jgi:hypothetical protein
MNKVNKQSEVPFDLNPTIASTIPVTSNTTSFIPQATFIAEDPFFDIAPLLTFEESWTSEPKKGKAVKRR